MPSLHVAYPLLIALEGWAVFNKPLRVVSIIYSASMIVAAAYLDHHWIIDILVGATYGMLAFSGARWANAKLAKLAGRAKSDAPIVAARQAASEPS
jgi:membrane-associated phospholipid phosphatase